MTARSLEERFTEKVSPEPNAGCWLWDGPYMGTGYGVLSLGRRSEGRMMAHRLSWTLYRGPIPDGLCVLHRCDVRICVNPAHLFLGTRQDNTRDMMQKGREARGDRHGSRTKPKEFRDGCRRGGVRGDEHHQAKLSRAKVEEIMLLKGAATLRDVAARYGVSISAISRVWRGETWLRDRDLLEGA